MWRVNFGNGQVEAVRSKAEGVRVIRSMTLYREYAFVQRYAAGTADDPGMWVTVLRGRDVQPEGGRS